MTQAPLPHPKVGVIKRRHWVRPGRRLLFFTLALLLHGASILLWSFRSHRPRISAHLEPPSQVPVQTISPAELARIKRKRSVRRWDLIPDPHDQLPAIMPTVPAPLSDRDRQVEREQRARIASKTLPQLLKPRAHPSVTTKPSARRPPGPTGKTQAVPLSRFGLKIPNLTPEGEPTSNTPHSLSNSSMGRGGGHYGANANLIGRPIDLPQNFGTPGSGTQLQLFIDPRNQSLPEGSETLLNSREWRLYPFYSRVFNAIVTHYVAVIMELYRLNPSIPRKLNLRMRHFEVELVLNADGSLRQLKELTSSGDADFEVKIKALLWEIRAFPNPPTEIIEADGQIHLPVRFISPPLPTEWRFRPPRER